MIKIGLTGNVCSGYEKVAEVFKSYGVPVFDADVAIKFLVNYRIDLVRDIKIQLGDIYKNNTIDSSKMNTTQKFNRLVDIIEPELIRMYESWRLSNKEATYTIFKSSILFERSLNKNMNYVISVFRPKDERVSSLCNSGLKWIDAYYITDNEMDELEKNQKSEWTIHNYDKLSLMTQCKKIHDNVESKSIKSLINKIDFNTVKSIFT